MLRHYELVVVLSPMINPDQATEAWDRIKGFISGREASINHEERWGTRRLAYPIRKGSYQFLEGNYHLTRFATDRPFNRELETFLKLDDNVIRSMVIATLPEDELAAQAAAQTRAIRPPPPRPVAAAATAVAEPDGSASPADAIPPAAADGEAASAEATTDAPSETVDAPAAGEEAAPEATADAPSETVDAPVAAEEAAPVASSEAPDAGAATAEADAGPEDSGEQPTEDPAEEPETT